MTARRTRTVTAVLLAGCLAVTGCTVSRSDDEPTAAVPESSEAIDGASERPSASAPEGPSPEELSADLLASARERAQRPVIASGSTVTADIQAAEIVMELIAVERTRNATLLEFRLSSPTPDTGISLGSFASVRFQSPAFVSALYLDDRPAGIRYRPLLFDDYRGACTCPYLPLVLGPEPQTISALFPPLPASTTMVDVNLGNALIIPAVAIAEN